MNVELVGKNPVYHFVHCIDSCMYIIIIMCYIGCKHRASEGVFYHRLNNGKGL